MFRWIDDLPAGLYWALVVVGIAFGVAVKLGG